MPEIQSGETGTVKPLPAHAKVVVIGGGVAAKLLAVLGDSGLIERFDDHGRRRPYLQSLPIYLSVDPLAGLRGAAAAINNCYLARRITPV